MILDSITLGIVSNLCYDLIKQTGLFTKDLFVSHFENKYPTKNNETVKLLASEIESLKLNDDMSEKAILKRLETSQIIQKLTTQIELETQMNTSQIHLGKGDNIAGDKVINVIKSS